MVLPKNVPLDISENNVWVSKYVKANDKEKKYLQLIKHVVWHESLLTNILESYVEGRRTT